MFYYLMIHIITGAILIALALLTPKLTFLKKHVSTMAMDITQAGLLLSGLVYGVALTIATMLTNSPNSWLPF